MNRLKDPRNRWLAIDTPRIPQATQSMRNPLQQVYASHTLRASCGDVELLPSVSLNRNG